MATLSPGQVYALARSKGFSPAGALGMVAVAATESGGRTDAAEPGGLGRGLVQIDLGQHPDVTEAQAFDPDFAMTWAYNASGKGDPDRLTAPLFYGPRDHPEDAAAAQREALASNPEENKDGLLDQITGLLGDAFQQTASPGGRGPLGAVTTGIDTLKSVAGFLAMVGRAVAWLATPRNLWRVAESILGLVLIFVGLAQLGGKSGAVATGAQKLTNGLLAGA